MLAEKDSEVPLSHHGVSVKDVGVGNEDHSPCLIGSSSSQDGLGAMTKNEPPERFVEHEQRLGRWRRRLRADLDHAKQRRRLMHLAPREHPRAVSTLSSTEPPTDSYSK